MLPGFPAVSAASSCAGADSAEVAMARDSCAETTEGIAVVAFEGGFVDETVAGAAAAAAAADDDERPERFAHRAKNHRHGFACAPTETRQLRLLHLHLHLLPLHLLAERPRTTDHGRPSMPFPMPHTCALFPCMLHPAGPLLGSALEVVARPRRRDSRWLAADHAFGEV